MQSTVLTLYTVQRCPYTVFQYYSADTQCKGNVQNTCRSLKLAFKLVLLSPWIALKYEGNRIAEKLMTQNLCLYSSCFITQRNIAQIFVPPKQHYSYDIQITIAHVDFSLTFHRPFCRLFFSIQRT